MFFKKYLKSFAWTWSKYREEFTQHVVNYKKNKKIGILIQVDQLRRDQNGNRQPWDMGISAYLTKVGI